MLCGAVCGAVGLRCLCARKVVRVGVCVGQFSKIRCVGSSLKRDARRRIRQAASKSPVSKSIKKAIVKKK